MVETLTYDVFLSHSSKDKPIVRAIAERLRSDGLRVWLDDWELRPGDHIPKKIEDGLEASRVLVLCMSANAFGSEWAQLESHTFRFRDPLKIRRQVFFCVRQLCEIVTRPLATANPPESFATVTSMVRRTNSNAGSDS